MSTITVLGGTGYTGGHIVAEAVSRGHDVTSYSRRPAAEPVDGATYRFGEAADAADIVAGSDIIVAALAPRGELEGELAGIYRRVATTAAASGARLVIVGGFSSLRPAADEPRFAEGDVPEEFRAEAHEMESVREWLTTEAPATLNWTFVSPAGAYGAWHPGEKTGTYRLGGDVALFTDDGKSEISGADFALAIVDEIERGQHVREHIGVAY